MGGIPKKHTKVSFSKRSKDSLRKSRSKKRLYSTIVGTENEESETESFKMKKVFRSSYNSKRYIPKVKAHPISNASISCNSSPVKRRSSAKQRFQLLSARSLPYDCSLMNRRRRLLEANADIDFFEEPYIKTRAQKSRYSFSKSYEHNGIDALDLLKADARMGRSKLQTPSKRKVNPKLNHHVQQDDDTTECSEDISDTKNDIEESNLEDFGDGDEEEVEEEVDEDEEDEVDDGEATKLEVPANVVKVYCTHCWPSFSYPWNTAGQTHSSSTGIVWSTAPDSRMLLTNAHSVQYAAVVQVRKRGDHQKYEAKVLCIGYDCDLALLTVEEDQFWENMHELRWGNSPRLEDPVTVVGYPVGGDNTSVTQGVVSRIDFQRYTVGSCNLLAIQIDAAINGGNSGGPALNSDKECVGIAFQSLKDSDTENIGYIIPCEVVFHFMEDYKRHGKYTGFGSCSFIWQKVENKCMQEFYGIKESGNGILISKVDKTSPAYGILKKGDIVLAIEDAAIATDGTVAFTNGERIAFEWMLCQRFAGDSVNFSIVRNKRRKEIVLPVVRGEPLVPTYLPEEKKPEYFIAGGLVFIPLTELFLTSEYGQDCLCRAPSHLVTASNRSHKEFENEQIVVIGHILAHEITVGYEDFAHYCVKEFNSQKIQNLNHLMTLVENCTDEYWRFDLDCDMVLILDAEAARNSLGDILKQNMIPAAKSFNSVRD